MPKTPTEIQVETYTEKLANLTPSSLNPRSIKKKAYEDLKKSLKEFPEMKEIREIVTDENLMILAGTQRYYILKELGETEVTVKKVTGLTDAKKREFMAKDNVHNGEWDTDIMANLWDPEELKGWGVPKFHLGETDDSEDEKPEKTAKEVECPYCGEAFTPQ